MQEITLIETLSAVTDAAPEEIAVIDAAAAVAPAEGRDGRVAEPAVADHAAAKIAAHKIFKAAEIAAGRGVDLAAVAKGRAVARSKVGRIVPAGITPRMWKVSAFPCGIQMHPHARLYRGVKPG